MLLEDLRVLVIGQAYINGHIDEDHWMLIDGKIRYIHFSAEVKRKNDRTPISRGTRLFTYDN